jgi:F420-dependent oxidoreductase-like protein
MPLTLRIMTEPQQGASYDDQLAVVRTAEETGFDAYVRSDHYLAFTGDGLPGPTDAWVTLAGLARDTSRIRLGTLVSPVTFRLPGPLAISVANVDAMSGGRIELGLGTGWHDGEHTAYGIPFPPLGQRFEMLEEQLEIVTGLWSTPVGEKYSFAGTHYTLQDSPALPKPVQQPRPPIIVGGAGRKRTPRLAARFADEFNVPFHGLDGTGEAIAAVRAACEAAGRDPDDLIYSAAQTIVCGSDEAELDRRATAIGRENGDHARKTALAGLPGEVVDTMKQFEALGCSRIYLQLLDLADLDQIRLVASDVMPAISG